MHVSFYHIDYGSLNFSQGYIPFLNSAATGSGNLCCIFGRTRRKPNDRFGLKFDLRSDQDVHGTDAVGVPDGLEGADVGVGIFFFIEEISGVNEELEAGVDEIPC